MAGGRTHIGTYVGVSPSLALNGNNFAFMRENPKITDNSNTEKISPGYTTKRLKTLSHPIVSVRDKAKAYDKSSAEIDTPPLDKTSRVKLETAALSSRLIPFAWKKMKSWIEENPPGVSLPGSSYDEPIPQDVERFASSFEGTNPKQAADFIKMSTEHLQNYQIQQLCDEWDALESKPDDSLSAEEIVLKKIYSRYKKVIGLGQSNVVDRSGEVVERPGPHLAGGMETGRALACMVLGVLPNVYKKQFGIWPTQEELYSLIEGAKPLILGIAASDIETMSVLQDKVFNSKISEDLFVISKGNGNLFLEIHPHVLDMVEKSSRAIHHSSTHTGCPALFSEGIEGKNVLIEIYDWIADLYKKYYIDTNNNYR